LQRMLAASMGARGHACVCFQVISVRTACSIKETRNYRRLKTMEENVVEVSVGKDAKGKVKKEEKKKDFFETKIDATWKIIDNATDKLVGKRK
jgi:hypothetical protein